MSSSGQLAPDPSVRGPPNSAELVQMLAVSDKKKYDERGSRYIDLVVDCAVVT